MKTNKIYIRVTDYEKQQLEEEAMRRGMTKSELIRSLIARFPAPSHSSVLEGRGLHPIIFGQTPIQ